MNKTKLFDVVNKKRKISHHFTYTRAWTLLKTSDKYRSSYLHYAATWAYDLKPIWGGTKFLPEKFVTVIVFPKKKKKKKKGHRPFRCTLSITFGLNMPSNVGPKWY